MNIIPGAEPLFHISGKKGVILFHGFLGSPFELKYIAHRLIDHDFSVSVPLLPGHGTSLEDMIGVTREDWLCEARKGYLKMADACEEVFIAGLSMGGVLTIILAAEFVPRKIALISTPRKIPDRKVIFAPLLNPFMKIVKKTDDDKGLACEEARKIHICYSNGIPVMATWHLMLLISKAMKLLPKVKSEVLIIQSKYDKVISPDSCSFIAHRIGSHKKEIHLVEEGNHTLTADIGKEKIADLLVRFFTSP
ncbi:MAG: alpha/beta hydrolase [Spirochaetes bacterium]|nr:alpha/beta hydrolase [Spirochaetota bacterium]